MRVCVCADRFAGYGAAHVGAITRLPQAQVRVCVHICVRVHVCVCVCVCVPIASPGYGAAHVGAISPTRAYLKPKCVCACMHICVRVHVCVCVCVCADRFVRLRRCARWRHVAHACLP
jgi:hypothetical protein